MQPTKPSRFTVTFDDEHNVLLLAVRGKLEVERRRNVPLSDIVREAVVEFAKRNGVTIPDAV